MKCVKAVSGLITVISLLLGVIWLGPVFAADAPAITSLGDLRVPGMSIPRAMDIDAVGNLFVADVDSGTVFRFDKYGKVAGTLDVQANGLGLAVNAEGTTIYVSQRGGNVAIYDVASGEQVGSLFGSSTDGVEFGVPGEIDLGPAGEYVYVADTVNRLIKIYLVSGSYVASVGGSGTGAGTFAYIGGMTVASNGQIVVADGNPTNFKVHVLTLDANFGLAADTTYGNGDVSVFGSELSSPAGLAFDDQGRAYFLEFIKSEVRVVDVSGASYSYLSTYAKPGLRVGQLFGVGDAVFDTVNSRLFVSCDGGRIEVFGIDGGVSPQYINHAPTAPTLQSPIAGSEVASVTPSLTFTNAADEDGDALTYNVVVSQGDTVVYQVNIPGEAGATTTATVDTALAENAAYTWTVQASDGTLSSDVSAAAAFVVNATDEAPSVPELIAPVNGESIDGQGALVWGAAVDPDPNDVEIAYDIEISTSENFEQIVASAVLNETGLTLGSFADYGALADGQTYFWRVSSMDNDQTTSLPSVAGQFVFDTAVLSVTANMPGAVVSLHGNHAYGGQVVGIAPIELRDLAPGAMSVVVERAGFEPFVANVVLGEKANVDLYAELVPSMSVDTLNLNRNGINGRSGLAVSEGAAPFLVDFDNDGDLDLLVGDAGGQVELFPNMQLAGRNRLYFDQGVALGLPILNGAKPFVADWNNDGRKDLIVGLTDGSVKLFPNSGSEEVPLFAAGEDLKVDGGTLDAGDDAAPVVVDYNGDGLKDLLVGNAAGQVLVYLNKGADAAPLLSAPTVELQLTGAVVPFAVDWDADGHKDLLVNNSGAVTVYSRVDGEYQPLVQFGDRRLSIASSFPIDLDGSGKQLVAGLDNGQLVYMTGNSNVPVASFNLALQDKAEELAGFVADEAPGLIDAANSIGVMISGGDYTGAADATTLLLSQLPEGSALQSATELLGLL